MNETDTMTGTAVRWWVDEYSAVPDPIEADTDYCFDTAAEHGQPWAVLEHPAAYTAGPVSPGHHDDAGLLPRHPRARPRRGPRHLVPLLLTTRPPGPQHAATTTSTGGTA